MGFFSVQKKYKLDNVWPGNTPPSPQLIAGRERKQGDLKIGW
jgi:hypothetical protein